MPRDLAADLSTAAFFGVPFVMLDNARDLAQQFNCARLIQPAPTSPNDASGYAGLFDDGVAGEPDKYCKST